MRLCNCDGGSGRAHDISGAANSSLRESCGISLGSVEISNSVSSSEEEGEAEVPSGARALVLLVLLAMMVVRVGRGKARRHVRIGNVYADMVTTVTTTATGVGIGIATAIYFTSLFSFPFLCRVVRRVLRVALHRHGLLIWSRQHSPNKETADGYQSTDYDSLGWVDGWMVEPC